MATRTKWTPAHLKLLLWIRDTPHHIFTVLENGRMATGKPKTWTHMRLTGHGTRTVVKINIWYDIAGKCIESGKPFDNRMFVPNSRGTRLIKSLERKFEP